MPTTAVKELHVAKSMKDLQSEIEIKPAISNRSTNQLVSAAKKVFQGGEISYLDKDEEKAYVHYMRFMELILLLKKRSDFGKDNHKLLFECANTAISKAEILKESLSKRYSILEEAATRENKKNGIIPTVHKSKPDVNDAPIEVPPEKSKEVEKLSITSSELHALLTSRQSSIIIMDTRPGKDFAESHIKHSCCISVPQEVLNPGLTAAKLESLLPKESLSSWYRRADVDYIVLIDWDSKNENTQSIHLNVLKVAMSKWDRNCVLKKTPIILIGGYKDWMLKYPMYTTQALNFDVLSDIESTPAVTDLSTIEYPNLDENASDEVHLLNEKNTNGMLFKKSPVPANILNDASAKPTYPDGRKSYSAPTVDRKSKPNVSISSKSSDSQIINNKNGNKSSYTSLGNKIPPPVDRNLKAVVLNPSSDKSNKDLILDSINKEQSLANESLEIAKQQLKNEEEFEKLCLRKELEAEESIRKEIQKQEEILIQKLKQLELQSKEKDAALLKIKEENLKMKKMLEEKVDNEYKKGKEKEISNALKEQTALRETVERMREERKRKEREAESQKKRDVTNGLPRESTSASTTVKRVDSHTDKPASNVADSSEYTIPLSRQGSSDSSSRGLVRSHSSPNIAQMVNEEENAQHKMPAVDRSLKPKVINSQLNEIHRARIRNLNPVYGHCSVRPATGLRNLGNTCFMNSIIQCLSNTVPLADYFLSGQFVDSINRENKQGTGGELVEEFAVIIKALWMGQYKSFYPRDFKNTVSRCLSVCIGNEQQDSHEFLVVLMEKLHADLKKKHSKIVPKLESNCSESSFWQHHKTYNNSKISDVFEGLLKSTLTCLTCGKTSNTFEVYSCLSLPIMASRCSLRECFQHFLRPEKIYGEAAWDCPRCKQKKEAEKCLSMCRLPEVLVIQLKRFSYEGLWRRKLQTYVDFDFSLEVPYEENSHDFYRLYSLYGIVNHYGTLEGGHYTAYCKTNTGKWFKYDDHEVSEISSSDIKTSAAYILFYISPDFQPRL